MESAQFKINLYFTTCVKSMYQIDFLAHEFDLNFNVA